MPPTTASNTLPFGAGQNIGEIALALASVSLNSALPARCKSGARSYRPEIA